jgi:hypothetical protein
MDTHGFETRSPFSRFHRFGLFQIITLATVPAELLTRMRQPMIPPKIHRVTGCADRGQKLERDEMKSRHRRRRKAWVSAAGMIPRKGDRK